jgi:hypothetical protein
MKYFLTEEMSWDEMSSCRHAGPDQLNQILMCSVRNAYRIDFVYVSHIVAT